MTEYRRKSPEDSLQSISRLRQGRLKIIISETLLQRMREVQAAQLIIGQFPKPLWYPLVKKTVVHFMLRRARWIDMLFVADYDPTDTKGEVQLI